ncbi:helix-turn-helix domain-containing protein [Streptomyces caniscabiei]|uniref:PucR family transcriptional regulator n=1 Tax=Streptomyces caniscabiei TaxID=2746961 RepID=A0A927QIR1_9ACTN|nr:PucR family transcriptional regulator [Streptomyces caniscabiei]MBD9723192.1 PucR family transcriptional regulator [Streptomyces caniscabiei]MDX3511872.1 helix-turn-helix domain-containing protein [Streptomyces caniscabiei]MDX3719074.1 helix-turn-helix domain-containing protein [Streptomyces caniscabiei]WEO26775.1 helix-turn-helix domain-containing protein [Streptomyces caniscabiei]
MASDPTAPPAPAVPPAPSVPPTPPVPLTALLAHGDLGLRQIAGPVDAGTEIHSAHASEMPDPYPYLLGGELLLTAGVHIPEAADASTSADDHFDDYFDAYVARVVAAGGAALGFGVAPVHDSVPEALVAACDAHGLPLIEVPPGTTFSGVARAVWQLMARARHAELRRVTEAQRSLAAAASRPDPVRAVLRQLARRLKGRAVLYGPDGTELASYGHEYGEPVQHGLAALVTVVRPSPLRGAGNGATSHNAPAPAHTPQPPTPSPRTPPPTSATDTVDGTHLTAYTLASQGNGFALGVATPHRTPGDHTIASVAAVLLSLLTGERQSGTGAARASALVRLLLGAEPQEVAPLLGPGTHWHVVHARPAEGAPRPEALAAAALGAALSSTLADVHGDVVRVLVPADREIREQPGWTCGVSAPAEPHAWPTADVQAARALARAKATRSALVRHGARTTLAHLVPTEDATAHAEALLAPVTAAPGAAALVETLRTWLSLHGSWDRTAVALAVHRNTVRQRVARCATLLDTDLDDPDVRMELWFALRQE